ncbi:hypothetical protein IWW36_004867, partial [Coemansia brasiliensis]
MLSEPNKAAGEADNADLKNWLPEFDHPRISLDLSALSPPDTAEASESDENPEPVSNASVNASSKSISLLDKAEAPAPQNEELLEAVVYANLSEYASIVSKEDEDNADDVLNQAQAPHTDIAGENDKNGSSLLQPPPSPTPSSSNMDSADLGNLANKLPEAPIGTNNNSNEADQLGVDFDFDTDPAIDAISTSPLFAVTGTNAPGASLGSAGGQDKQNALETPQLGQQQLPSAARKGRSRRASIAGMLMRRASKYIDAASPTLAATANTATSTSSSANVAQVLSESCKQESKEQAVVAASETKEESNEAPASKDTVASNELKTQSADSDKQESTDSASGSPTDDECNSKDQNDDTINNIATIATDTSNDNASVNLVKSSDKSASDEHVEASQAAEPDTSVSMAKEVSPLPPPSQPRSVEKRSSRILSGITRKVNHVRQTTSMVLRRSVGSRLLVAPGKSLDTVNGPTPKQDECSATQDQKDMVRDEPPQYTSEEHNHAATNSEANNAAVSAMDTTTAAHEAAEPVSDSQEKAEPEAKPNAEASISDIDNATSAHDSNSESTDNNSVASDSSGSSSSSNNVSDKVDEVEATSNDTNSEDAKAHA